MEENNSVFEENAMPSSFLFQDDDISYLFAPKPERPVSPSNSNHRRHRHTPQKTKTNRIRHTQKGAKQKKIDQMTRRILELEKEIQLLKQKNSCDRCKSRMDPTTCHPIPSPSQYCTQQQKQLAKPHQSSSPPISREFQQFEIESSRPQTQQLNLSGQIWIVMGLLMMIMGININGFDGTIDVYKITKQTVDYVRKQVEKSVETIVLPVFFSKVFSLEGSLGISNEIANQGFQLEGLRLESIDENQLMFEEHRNFHLKYEALIVMMEYMKQYASIQ